MKNEFIHGWWNCFNAFALEILSRNPNSDYLANVLKDAGVKIEEIRMAINSKLLTESLEKWLEEYIEKFQ